MKLTIEERVILSGVLPEEHTYQVIKAKVKLLEEMGFNEEETRKYDVKSNFMPDGKQQIMYNKEAAHGYEKEVKVPPILKQIIRERLVQMDKDKKINHHLLTIYEKFVL